MSWFKIDDGFHCNAKIMEAGTPAVGLYVRCGSWAAQQASDGRVPKSIAKSYGTARMIKALLEVGLWHEGGHECETCPEIDAKSYLIHDYLEFNPSRVAIQNERNAKTIRQQRWRDGKKKDQVEDGTATDVDGDVDASTRRHGDGNPVPARPVPSPSTSVGSTASSGERDRTGGVPDRLAPLRDALAAAGLGAVAWDIKKFTDWERIRRQLDRLGIELMVKSALAAAKSRGEPDNVAAWIGRWESLADPKHAARDSPEPPSAPLPEWCGKCDSPDYRWLDNGTGYVRCRNCNPDAMGDTR
jgi:hypothetical protein